MNLTSNRRKVEPDHGDDRASDYRGHQALDPAIAGEHDHEPDRHEEDQRPDPGKEIATFGSKPIRSGASTVAPNIATPSRRRLQRGKY
jgi:hypothetical protein